MEKSKAGNGPGEGLGPEVEEGSDDAYKVADKRHWAAEDEQDDGNGEAAEEPTSRTPSIIDEYRARAEEAERQLHDYIEAYKNARAEQDQVRKRLQADVDRRAGQRFGNLVADLLQSVDNLDLALQHAGSGEGAQALAKGVELARDGFINSLLQHGVERIQPHGALFDPNEAEAVRMDPVEDAARHDHVTEVLRPGYRLGEQVLRPAQVAVGRRS